MALADPRPDETETVLRQKLAEAKEAHAVLARHNEELLAQARWRVLELESALQQASSEHAQAKGRQDSLVRVLLWLPFPFLVAFAASGSVPHGPLVLAAILGLALAAANVAYRLMAKGKPAE